MTVQLDYIDQCLDKAVTVFYFILYKLNQVLLSSVITYPDSINKHYTSHPLGTKRLAHFMYTIVPINKFHQC